MHMWSRNSAAPKGWLKEGLLASLFPSYSLIEKPKAAWKLNNCTLMVDQCLRFEAAARSWKARTYPNQTRPANWRWVRRMSSWYCIKSFQRCGKWEDKIRQKIEKASNQLVMSSTRPLGFFGVNVSTSCPLNSNWGSGSFSTKFVESSLCNSTNLPATIQLTSFAGTGEKPGPTTKGWCKIGV